MATNKVLWVVNLPNIHAFLQQAQAVKATAVAIRTTANNLDESIPAFHDAGIHVYVFGWSFPPVVRLLALDQAEELGKLDLMGLSSIPKAINVLRGFSI